MDHLEESYKSKIVNIDKLKKSNNNKKIPKYENKQLSNKQLSNKQYENYYSNYEDGLWLTGC